MEIKYKITDADMEKINKGIMWKYFLLYIIVACAGIVVGIIATVFKPSISIMVLGIMLMVLGAILAVCAILLAVLPKSFVVSALIADNELERDVKFDENGVTVSTEGQDDIKFSYSEIVNVKIKNYGMLLYLDKNNVLPVLSADKDLISNISAFVCATKASAAAKKPEAEQAPAEDAAAEQTPADEPDNAVTDGNADQPK